MLFKVGVLEYFENYTGKHLQIYLKETPTQVFSCENC